MNNWINLFSIFIILLPLVACQPRKGEPGSQGKQGIQGEVGPQGPSTQIADDGTSSGGGGGFLHKNSKPLFSESQKALVSLLEKASAEVFSPLGPKWNKEEVIRVFQNIRVNSEKSLKRNGDDELLYNYGEENGEAFLEVLKPFFDYYSTVPIRGPKGDYYYRVQTQIVIELLHEFAHLVFKHPIGDVSPEQVQKIEDEAATFADNFFISLVSEGFICITEFQPEMFGIKLDEEEQAEFETKNEKVIWALPTYGERGPVFKTESVDQILQLLADHYKKPVEIDELTFFKEESGILNNFIDGVSFPPSPRYEQFFGEFKQNEELWHTVVFESSFKNPSEIKFVIKKYDEGFEESMPPNSGGLIQKLQTVNSALYGVEMSTDFSLSDHSVEVPISNPSQSNYSYRNVNQKSFSVDRSKEEDVENNLERHPKKQKSIECNPVSVPIDDVTPWS